MNLISIIVPSYNNSGYIEACLDSIYFQDHDNIELIIVDDCSLDCSAEVIEKWIHNIALATVSYASYYDEKEDVIMRVEDKRYLKNRSIVFMKNERNRGSTWTYNRGFRAASGSYCTFVASDDICHPQLFSTLSKPLDEDMADFVYADMFIVDDSMRIMREFRLPDYNFRRSFCDWYLCGVATLYRRSLHNEYGYYDENAMADDHECYLRFALGGARFMHVAKTLYSVRSHHKRQAGLHGKERFNALLNHSKRLTLEARAWAAVKGIPFNLTRSVDQAEEVAPEE